MQSVILGTAQWGLDYGATNSVGRLSDVAIQDLVQTARGAGIRTLDTAPAYGDAESRIGHLAREFGVQTKASATGGSVGVVRESFEASCAALDRTVVDVLLIHDWPTLAPEARDEVARELEALRDARLVDAVGISGYEESDVSSALGAFRSLDVVQVPVSVLDQRLVGSVALSEVRDRGGRVQARSVLLQGAAVAGAEHPVFGAHPDVVRLRVFGDPLSLCMGFVSSQPWVDEVVVAVTSAVELEQLLRMRREPTTGVDWPALASSDPWLVDPRRWNAPAREG